MRYLKVVFAAGVVPGKWFSRFDERVDGWQVGGARSDDPLRHVLSGAADIAIVRFPGPDWDGGVGTGELSDIRDIGEREMLTLDLHRVRLYDETPGVAFPVDHALDALGENEAATESELVDEMVLYRGVDPVSVRENLEVVAANVGCVVAPRPLLRGINRKGVAHRDLSGVPGTAVGLVWRRDRDDEVLQQFVGICRGRRPSSSR
ncbi:LysR family transcriptional regulator substrate-binding protein [Corynebacterium terpenotabidum]|uniref:LysR substrate-binding domain-containing protein n=1 Tax=Corynebacterium terpenotabidum Y-11 TaxID=1200352 RepID=S4XHQ6_9CORY|nr:LysR family transcriptional regulator substrate-binding protein [Corynebacterium terpenotabidum]AGP31215.1 hypothetical protein A606_07850 [Corynebacterium terpenotabidum Y-11]